MLLKVVEPRVSGDVKHPGLEMAVGAKRLAIFEHAKKHVLHEIFCDGSAAGETGKEIKKGAVMPVEQNAELGNVAVSDGQHQIFVGLNHSYVTTYGSRKGYQ